MINATGPAELLQGLQIVDVLAIVCCKLIRRFLRASAVLKDGRSTLNGAVEAKVVEVLNQSIRQIAGRVERLGFRIES